jgi:hypothetical protein
MNNDKTITMQKMLTRRIFSLFLVFNVFIYNASAQNFTYYVLTMKGSVSSKNMGREYQTGDIITTDDEVTFKGESDMVGLIRSDGKRFILKNSKEKRGARLKYDEAKMIGKTRIEWKNLTLNSIDDLQDYFCKAPFIFLDSVARIRINPKTYAQNGAQFFYFSFLWKNQGKQEPVDKKLEFKRDTLILRQNSIFKVDKKAILREDVSDYTLWYYNRSELQKIGLFNVIFPDQEKMKQEIKIMVDIHNRNKVPPSIIHSDVEAFIRQFYGNIDKINLIHWLKRYIGVPEK